MAAAPATVYFLQGNIFYDTHCNSYIFGPTMSSSSIRRLVSTAKSCSGIKDRFLNKRATLD